MEEREAKRDILNKFIFGSKDGREGEEF